MSRKSDAQKQVRLYPEQDRKLRDLSKKMQPRVSIANLANFALLEGIKVIEQRINGSK